MDHPFQLPVTYKGVDLEFETRLQLWTYGRRFYVTVDGAEILFEQDEEGNFRAILPPETMDKMPPKELVEEIGKVIEALVS